MTTGERGYAMVLPAGRPGPVVVSSPHSGTLYPPELLAALTVDLERQRKHEDGPTAMLAGDCPGAGATLLAAHYARAYVDLNRAPTEIHPELLGGDTADHLLDASAKVQAGLGVIPSRIGAQPLYLAPPGAAVVRTRLERGYLPYHSRLRELLRERVQDCGVALLVDCHSMPVEAAGHGRHAVEIAVGDRFGTSCARSLIDEALDTLAAHGFRVALNRPYAGGFITEHHGRPGEGRHALQLEIRRDLFMDPASHALTDGAARITTALEDLVRRLVRRLAVLPPTPQRARPVTRATAELRVPELLRAAD